MTHLGKPRDRREEDHSGYLEQPATSEVEIRVRKEILHQCTHSRGSSPNTNKAAQSLLLQSPWWNRGHGPDQAMMRASGVISLSVRVAPRWLDRNGIELPQELTGGWNVEPRNACKDSSDDRISLQGELAYLVDGAGIIGYSSENRPAKLHSYHVH